VGEVALNAFLSGTLIVFLYGPLPMAVADADFLLRFEGEIGRDQRVAALSFDFRLMDGRIEVRHAVPDGDIVVGIGSGALTFRGQNGTFTCDLATLSCV
jgi:hypothetical protein